MSNITLDWQEMDNVGLIKHDAGIYDNYMPGKYMGYSKVFNLTLENVTIKGKNYVGAFGGKDVLVESCSVIGNSEISGQGDYVGGIVGCNSGSSHDMSYYNGIAFKGFIEGIPTGILSGGEYDGLMKKMKRKSRAIGFAVYLDEISRL